MIIPFKSSLGLLSKIISLTPTITNPTVTKPIPNHLNPCRREPRKATENKPVKIMTAPKKINIISNRLHHIYPIFT